MFCTTAYLGLPPEDARPARALRLRRLSAHGACCGRPAGEEPQGRRALSRGTVAHGSRDQRTTYLMRDSRTEHRAWPWLHASPCSCQGRCSSTYTGANCSLPLTRLAVLSLERLSPLGIELLPHPAPVLGVEPGLEAPSAKHPIRDHERGNHRRRDCRYERNRKPPPLVFRPYLVATIDETVWETSGARPRAQPDEGGRGRTGHRAVRTGDRHKARMRPDRCVTELSDARGGAAPRGARIIPASALRSAGTAAHRPPETRRAAPARLRVPARCRPRPAPRGEPAPSGRRQLAPRRLERRMQERSAPRLARLAPARPAARRARSPAPAAAAARRRRRPADQVQRNGLAADGGERPDLPVDVVTCRRRRRSRTARLVDVAHGGARRATRMRVEPRLDLVPHLALVGARGQACSGTEVRPRALDAPQRRVGGLRRAGETLGVAARRPSDPARRS